VLGVFKNWYQSRQKEILEHTIIEIVDSSGNEVPLFDEIDYFAWRAKMKEFLKIFGVWETMINAHVPSKNQSKAVVKREAKKNDSTALKFILDGLPSSIKENVEEYTSARDLWLKLEKEYQNKRQDTEKITEEKPTKDMKKKDVEEKPIKDMKQESLQDPDDNEGKNPPESTWILDEENLLKNKIEISMTLQEIEYSADINCVRMNKYDLFDFKEKVLETLEKYQDCTTMLKQLLKKQEEENIRIKSERLKQEEENIRWKSKRLKQEEDMARVSKNIYEDLEETRKYNVILKTQLEEAKGT
jgi:hypothetical protein